MGRWGRLSETTGLGPPKPKPDFTTENTEIAEGEFRQDSRDVQDGDGDDGNQLRMERIARMGKWRS